MYVNATGGFTLFDLDVVVSFTIFKDHVEGCEGWVTSVSEKFLSVEWPGSVPHGILLISWYIRLWSLAESV